MMQAWTKYKQQHPWAAEQSVLGLSLLLLVLYFYFDSMAFVYAIGILVIVSVTSKKFRNGVGAFWWILALGLRKTFSPVVLFMLFFFILCPWAFLFRLFNKDHLKLSADRKTQLIEKTHEFSEADFNYPF